MSYTLDSEILLVNQALDRIAAKNITLTLQTTNEALATLRHYPQTLSALIRSYEWPFLTDRKVLSAIYTLTLEEMPTSAWVVGDTITGITSGATAEILTVVSDSEYEIIHLDGTFEDGETITNATVETLYYEGVELTYEDETVVWYDSEDAEQSDCDLTVSTLTPDYEWTYQYQLPNDFKRLINVYEENSLDALDDRWTIEGNRILTNYTTVSIKYVKDITDPADFDPLFYDILVLRLALKLVAPLVGIKATQLVAEIKDELRQVESKARQIAFQENNQTGISDFVNARYGS